MFDQFQSVAIDRIAHGSRHTNIEACAGSGKSTVILAGLDALPGNQTCMLAAHGKDARTDLRGRAPQHVKVQTFHSHGLAALRRALRRVDVDTSKGFRIARAVARDASDGENWSVSPGDIATRLLHATRLAKSMLVRSVPEVVSLIVSFGLDDPLIPANRLAPLVAESLRRTTAEPGVVDYDDMIYLPLKLQVPIPSADCVIIDEAQDLSPAQVLIMRSACRWRFIAVGDPRQAISFFRGADHLVMARIAKELGSEVLPLSVTYRCPRAVVAFIKTEVSGLADIEAAPDAPEGVVETMTTSEFLGPFGPRPGDFVLSRTNAPLMQLCTHFLRRGIPAVVAGREVGYALLGLIDRAKKAKVSDLLRWLDEYRSQEVARVTALGQDPEVSAERVQRVDDEIEAIRAVARGLTEVSVVRELIHSMFSDANPEGAVVLSTVHKAKGLERDTVWLLEKTFYSGPNEVEEANIFYVAATRARRRLVIVDDRTSS